ncbi:MAG: LysR substrate-binding domain-containing protein, partial [Methyloceanibacter sp.]
DAAILFGAGSWPGMEAKLLYQECISAVASPSYLRRQGEFRTVDDITRGTLLQLEDEKQRWVDWPQWLRKMGARPSKTSDSLYFNNYPTLLQAAANGQGIALGWHGLISDKLEDKTLMEVLPKRFTSHDGYFITHPTSSSTRPEVKAFLSWIADEALDEPRPNASRSKAR